MKKQIEIKDISINRRVLENGDDTKKWEAKLRIRDSKTGEVNTPEKPDCKSPTEALNFCMDKYWADSMPETSPMAAKMATGPDLLLTRRNGVWQRWNMPVDSEYRLEWMQMEWQGFMTGSWNCFIPKLDMAWVATGDLQFIYRFHEMPVLDFGWAANIIKNKFPSGTANYGDLVELQKNWHDPIKERWEHIEGIHSSGWNSLRARECFGEEFQKPGNPPTYKVPAVFNNSLADIPTHFKNMDNAVIQKEKLGLMQVRVGFINEKYGITYVFGHYKNPEPNSGYLSNVDSPIVREQTFDKFEHAMRSVIMPSCLNGEADIDKVFDGLAVSGVKTVQEPTRKK